jgi:hypothetical protein
MHELAPIVEAFDYIDAEGSPAVSAEAELYLGNGQSMTIRAGGALPSSAPVVAPFTHYEVILDHDPPRFWKRFSEEGDLLVYDCVPRLHIAHHAVRHGGVVSLSMERQVLARKVHETPVQLPITTMEQLAELLSRITGRSVTTDALK